MEIRIDAGSVEQMTSPALCIDASAALIGTDLDVLRDARLIIHDGSITRVGPATDVEVPYGADRIDASELTLLPGFIDSHVHIGFFRPAAIAAGGVTTVRDLGWPPDEIFRLVEASKDGRFQGPAILAAGTMITAPGGYPTRAAWAPPGTGAAVADALEAEQAVRSNVDRGAAVIKIALNPPVGPVLPAELVRVIVATAHEAGLKVTGHIYGLDELGKALDAGIDELAHMLMSEEAIPQHVLERMVASEVVVVPTLSIRSGSDRAVAISNLSRFRELGGRVIYGTDLGNEGPRPGIDRTEIAGLAEAGMSPSEIVRAATVDAAAWLGLERTGVLQEGARADVIGVQADPTRSYDALTAVELVLRDGKRLR